MPTHARIEVTRDGPVAVLSLDHPPGNRLTQAMISALSSQLTALERDSTVRAVVVVGAGGRTFCDGLDEEEWASLPPKERSPPSSGGSTLCGPWNT